MTTLTILTPNNVAKERQVLVIPNKKYPIAYITHIVTHTTDKHQIVIPTAIRAINLKFNTRTRTWRITTLVQNYSTVYKLFII